MSGTILYFSHGIGDFGTVLLAKIGRTFDRIGYARAAAELNRLGYVEQAKYCIRQMNSL